MESVGGVIIQEMAAGHGWVSPLINDSHIPTKPPLYYWVGATIARVRGSGGDIFDARVASALLGALGIAVVYWFGSRVAGRQVGRWAALILLTTPQYIIQARDPRVDMSLTLFLAAALFLAHLVCEGDGGRGTAILAAVCVGLATLSKGPIAPGMAVTVLLLAAVLNRPAPTWRHLVAPATVAVAVAIPLVWYVAATVEHGWAFVELQVFRENFRRAVLVSSHKRFFHYFAPLISQGLPWTIVLPGAIVGSSALPVRTRRFLWVWVGTMFVALSLSAGKRNAYLLVVRPALAVLLAGWIVPQLARLADRWQPREQALPRALYLSIGAVLVCTLIAAAALRAGVAGFGASDIHLSHWWREYFRQHLMAFSAGLVLIAIASALTALWIRQRRLDLAAYGGAVTLALALSLGIATNDVVHGDAGSFRPFAETVAHRVPAGTPLAFFRTADRDAYGFLFHLRRHVPVVQVPNPAEPCVPPAPGLYLVRERMWDSESCFRDARWQELERGGPAVKRYRPARLVLASFGAG